MDVFICFRVASLLLVLVDLILVIADLATPNKSTEVHKHRKRISNIVLLQYQNSANNFHLVGSQGEKTSEQPK